jgi:hypothetical protein
MYYFFLGQNCIVLKHANIEDVDVARRFATMPCPAPCRMAINYTIILYIFIYLQSVQPRERFWHVYGSILAEQIQNNNR